MLSEHLKQQKREHNRVLAELRRLERSAELFSTDKREKKLTRGRGALMGIVSAAMVGVSVLTFSPNAVGYPIGDVRWIVFVINVAILVTMYKTGKE